MKSHLEELIEKLAVEFHKLLRIEPDGTSECPFAEAWYFTKEEAAFELRKHVQGLRELRASYRDRLHKSTGEEAKHCRAELHNMLQEITEGEKALARADTKKFPREPRGPFGERVGQPLPSTSELLSNEHKVRYLTEGK
jgi:hypothetical protein